MNLKLIKLPSDIIIETLTKRIQDLEHDLTFSKLETKMVRQDLEYYKQMSNQNEQFKYYLLFKDKLEELCNEDIDIETLIFNFTQAYKEKDINTMSDIFEKVCKYQSPELLATIYEQQQEIIDLNSEIDELKQELEEEHNQ